MFVFRAEIVTIFAQKWNLNIKVNLFQIHFQTIQMMKVIVVFKRSIQMGVTAGIFLASILLKEMRYLVYIRYLWSKLKVASDVRRN